MTTARVPPTTMRRLEISPKFLMVSKFTVKPVSGEIVAAIPKKVKKTARSIPIRYTIFMQIPPRNS